jgi:hypothetical protein
LWANNVQCAGQYDHLINKKARPNGLVQVRAIINENMPSSGAPAGFPDFPQSLKQWDCPRSSSEHALRLVRKTLLKGRGLFPLHGAPPCCCWDGCAKARPGFGDGSGCSRTCRSKGGGCGTDLLIRLSAVGSYRANKPSEGEPPRLPKGFEPDA